MQIGSDGNQASDTTTYKRPWDLFLAVADFGTHTAFLATHFAATFTCSFRTHQHLTPIK